MRMSKKATGAQTICEEDEEGRGSEDEESRACGVCGDLAKGYHFNALTCEGCKGFFRRAIKRSTQLHCPFLNKCIITKNNRRSCQACRFRKCQAIGMRKEMVMSEKEVLERRIRIKKKKMLDAPIQLSSQQKEIIQELVCGHRSTFDSAFSSFSGFRPMDRILLSMISVVPLKNQGTKKEKRSLTMGDQIALLKGATFEIMQIRFNMVFNAKTSIWECGQITYCIDDAVRAGFQPLLLEPLLKFHHTLRKLGLQEEEYVLMQAMSLFSPGSSRSSSVHPSPFSSIIYKPYRPGVLQHSVIDELHENLALTLKTWIDCKRKGPEKHLLYPKVMACLTEMRTMTEEYSKQVLQIQDIQPDDISPLILEVVSKNPCNDF
ncbi:nuclear receptor subfamily 1 group I member 2 isoform X6 [Xiphias gladius]|uniref:nuclear receptor subfamily 1 group I member 2 isoform X6 n=1 Tax=Xiphias gladius TaxID=8245 RepID=UPI001A9A14FE|nr:nuclear receptor subfamily 1 group I member 2 isoform X6 [Xiphias gladius]